MLKPIEGCITVCSGNANHSNGDERYFAIYSSIAFDKFWVAAIVEGFESRQNVGENAYQKYVEVHVEENRVPVPSFENVTITMFKKLGGGVGVGSCIPQFSQIAR